MVIAVFTEEVGSILQNTYHGLKRNSHNLAVHHIARHQLRLERRNFLRQIGAQVDQIPCENPRPDHIDSQDIGNGATLLQKFAPEVQ
jgi:hypothetical protein